MFENSKPKWTTTMNATLFRDEHIIQFFVSLK